MLDLFSSKFFRLSIPIAGIGLLAAALHLMPPPSAVEASSSKKEMRAQGASLFAEKGCAHCHGASGFGGSDSGPDLSKVRKELKPEQIAHQIKDGGKNMPPFGGSLSEDEIASLVEYLHAKRKAPPGWSPGRPQANAQPGAWAAATLKDPE